MSEAEKPAAAGEPLPKAETAPPVSVPVPAPVQAPAVASDGVAPTAPVTTSTAPVATAAGSNATATAAESTAPTAVPATIGATTAEADSLDLVESEGPTVDERLWATTLWMSTALMIFLPPIPVFLAPLIVKKLRKRPSEFVSWHAGNSLRFATIATLFQVVYWVCAGMTALSLHRYWMLAFVPAVTLYTSFAVGLCTWLTLVGHNAWKGRRHRPSELRNLVFYK